MEISSLPYTIKKCGYYYVTDCLKGKRGKHGITIAPEVHDVTIDLCGYALLGVRGSLDGIHAEAVNKNIVVKNGTVRGWGGHGIDLEAASYVGVYDVRAWENGGIGIHTGDGGLIDRCHAIGNKNDGIVAHRSSVVINCIASLNQGDGIISGHVQENAGGINSGSLVRSSSACFNMEYGIRVAPAGVVADCSVVQNSGGAIEGEQSLVRGNSAGGNIDLTASTQTENHQW